MIASEHLATGKRSHKAHEEGNVFFLQRHNADELTLEFMMGPGTKSSLLNPV